MTDSTLRMLHAERDLIRLIARFDDCAISTNLEGFRRLWTDDAVWTIGDPLPMLATGPTEIVAALKALQDTNTFFFRCTGLPVIAVGDDTAEMVSPTLEYAGRAGQRLYANVARYRDRAVRTQSGEWRFASRTYEYLWVDTDSRVTGSAVPVTLPAH